MPELSLVSKFGSLCNVTCNCKSNVKYTVVNCGDSCFSFWVDTANGRDSAYLAVEILSCVAAYLKLWRAWPKACYKTVGWTLPTMCSKMSLFQITQCVYVWGFLFLLLWAEVASNAFLRSWEDQRKGCIWWMKATYTSCDHSWRIYCRSWNTWCFFSLKFSLLLNDISSLNSYRDTFGSEKHIPDNLRITGGDI